jgi:hypothetical protein
MYILPAAMNAAELAVLRNEDYEWLCAQANDPNNDVTADYESSDPNIDAEAFAYGVQEIQKSYLVHTFNVIKPKHQLARKEYALVRAYASKSRVAIIRDVQIPENGNVIEPQSFDAFVIESMNDTDGIFASRDPSAMLAISDTTGILADISAIIWHYAREPICTVAFNVGGNDIFTSPVYEFPFAGFPKDPIPIESHYYHTIRIATQPLMKNFSITRKNILFADGYYPSGNRVVLKKNGFDKFMYLKGFDAVAKSGMWCRGDDWRRHCKSAREGVGQLRYST